MKDYLWCKVDRRWPGAWLYVATAILTAAVLAVSGLLWLLLPWRGVVAVLAVLGLLYVLACFVIVYREDEARRR